MIVPDYWAEARKQHRALGKQVTVRRFGWSTVSDTEAQAMAERRAQEALDRILAGDKLDARERKAAYNGAVGVPIREEVLSRHAQEVITRNSYGAHCLNSPRALFADVDFSNKPNTRHIKLVLVVLLLAVASWGWLSQRWGLACAFAFGSLLFASTVAATIRNAWVALQGGHEILVVQKIREFLRQHPAWNVRVYRTPGGLRLLATHQPFDATDPLVQEFFDAVGTDPLYVRMCRNQQCFRARLTAKPWRIGVPGHMRPRPGLWPVRPEKMAVRQQWIARYEQAAAGFAACRFVESLGSGAMHPDIGEVVELHDREARVLDLAMPIA
jgi:hypothetical protein